MNVTKIMTRPLKSSFFSCEKDAEEIIKRLFVSSQPYSDQLKRLLIINTKDCLDNSNQDYAKIVKNTSVQELIEENYISLVPRINRTEHEEVKSYIILSFDHFSMTLNPEYRDCQVCFDILCDTATSYLDNYQTRPLKIAGIIRPKENSDAQMLKEGIGYTSLLTKKIIENNLLKQTINDILNNVNSELLKQENITFKHFN